MRYERFEDLPVWNEAIRLAEGVYLLTQDSSFKGFYSFKDQLERAGLSVSNNIAEGFERGTNNELITFLYIAKGSAGEVRSMLCVLQKLNQFRAIHSEIENLKKLAESCSRQIRAWAESLQNSSMKGPKFVNDKVREETRKNESAKAFEKVLRDKLPANHPMRRQDS